MKTLKFISVFNSQVRKIDPIQQENKFAHHPTEAFIKVVLLETFGIASVSQEWNVLNHFATHRNFDFISNSKSWKRHSLLNYFATHKNFDLISNSKSWKRLSLLNTISRLTETSHLSLIQNCENDFRCLILFHDS